MLSVNHVTKKYHKTIANNDINIQVEDGQIAVLLGPNGAGKSTIIKCITGFLKHEGSIIINGFASKTVEAKQLLGYVPEIPSFYPNLTVEEHLEFIARTYKLTDYKDFMNELLDRFELSDKRGKFGDELSKGMKQKLSICCGLLTKPKLIIFDEPMIGLDPHAIKELKLFFKELADNGSTVLVSTHMIDSIEDLWDVTYIMQNGNIKACIHKDELSSLDKSLEDIFFEVTEGASLQDESVNESEVS